MQKITPFLWFDHQAEEAMNFYTSLFDHSKVESISRYADGPMQGKVLTGVFRLDGQQFMALDGGPEYKFTPSTSFFVNCETEEEVDELWGKLSPGGSVLMPLQAYPFSEKFGWIADKYGVSWQLNLAGRKQKITPFLMFVAEQHGNAEEAMKLYTSLFENSSIKQIERYAAGEPGEEGMVKHAVFTLDSQEFMAMESNLEHQFTFSEAISFYVNCDTQEEVNMLWDVLTDGGEEMPCGWLKDRYGVTWQIIPSALPELLNDPDPEKAQRVMQAMLQMKKIDVEGLRNAAVGEMSR